ncbi:MAG: hypothetical protein KAX49_03650 [Halanaerobiales bacterium]|nr:hypothetical protein [Halanaerobiales bacterium]
MKMSIKYLKILSLNPFLMGKIFQNFLEGYGSPVEFKLIFYVLPIILYKDSRDKLSTANKTSRIDTLFGKKCTYGGDENLKLSGKVNLSGFLERFEELKELTKTTLIVLSNEEKIQIGNMIVLKQKDKYDKYYGNIRATLKAAYYLGVILAKTSTDNLDNFLGVSVA